MSQFTPAVVVDSDPDVEIVGQATKEFGSHGSSIIVLDNARSRNLLDCIELPIWPAERKKEFKHGRFLASRPDSPDLDAGEYLTGLEEQQLPKKPRWKTIADSSDDEGSYRPSRRQTEGDYESIEIEDSDEPDYIDVDLESEGNEWDRRPRGSTKRNRKPASRSSAETIEVGV
jgi:hypothetical protein